MADNVVVPGTGATLAFDEIGGVLYARTKVSVGADGAAADLAFGRGAAAASLPVVLSNEDSANLAALVAGLSATQPVSLASAISVAAPDNIATAQVSVAATATLIAAARAGRRSITVEQLGTTAVYLGAAGVTTGIGVLLAATVGSSVTFNTTAAIYGITASGSQTVAEFELY